VCQVFDTFTGQYTSCANKTEAAALDATKKQDFLASCGLDKVNVLTAMPIPPKQPKSKGTQAL
jgi:hypothetical protein